MTKVQKTIILAAASLIIIAFLFPPYWDAKIGEDGELYGKHTKWEFNQSLRDTLTLDRTEMRKTKDGGIQFGYVPIFEYPVRDDLLLLEIFCILVLAGAASLVAKKKRPEGRE